MSAPNPEDVEKVILSTMPRYRWTCDDAVQGVDLKGKVIIVTGATNGIGIPTATALARTGAHLILTARDPARGQDALQKIKAESKNENVEVLPMDLVSFATIRSFAEEIIRRGLKVHALLHNAGIMAVPFEKTVDGFESQIQVNWLSVGLLTKLLLPTLQAGSRVVVVSSIAHKRLAGLVTDVPAAINFDDQAKYDKWVAYAVAKAAVIQFCNEANRIYQSKGITFNSVHPGGIMTGLQSSMTDAEKRALGWIDENGRPNPAFKTVEQGGATATWATVTSELEGKGGFYLENCAITEKTSVDTDPFLQRVRGTTAVVWDEEQSKKLFALLESKIGTFDR
eukprot:PhF_6_TR12911/c0_g1_i2/m.20351